MISWAVHQSLENFPMQSLELKDVCWLEHRDLFYLTLKYATTEFRYMCYEVTFVLVKVEKFN